jgi:DNA-binding PadR family transcriptional regulator
MRGKQRQGSTSMSLKHAILGFLNYKPFSGYDLKKAFDTSVQHFWPADQSQIYRTLAQLAEQGLAEVEIVEQADRPNLKRYTITEAGREELRRWLVTPLPPKPHRSAELIQVFFAGQLDDDEILAMFERAAQSMRETLGPYDKVPEQSQPYVEMIDSPRESFFWFLTLEMGIKIGLAQLEWMESVIQRIKNKEHPPA